MLKSFKVKLGKLFENRRNHFKWGWGLEREERAGLISHIFPIALKGCKHLISNSSWEGKNHCDSRDSGKQYYREIQAWRSLPTEFIL